MIITACKRSCGQVMFLHLSVIHSVHMGGHAWGAVRGGGDVAGACDGGAGRA